MPPADDEKDLNPDETTPEEEPSDVTDNNNNSGDASLDPKKDWEKSYKGLQTASAKKQQELQDKIAKLEESISGLTEQVESQKTDKDVLGKQLIKAKEELEGAQSSLDEVNQEKAKLDAQVERTSVISKKYPSLSPFSDYIPQGASIEEFEQNAEAFKEALSVYTDNFVSGTLEGASPPPPERHAEEISESEEDRLWSNVVQTAGVPGKEKEYQDSYDKWLKIQAARQNQ